MALSCGEVRQRLDTDEALDAADVREHVAACAECRRALERWRAVAGELRVWAEASPPAFLHTRVMAGLRSAAEVEPRGWRAWFRQRPVWASSAMAAAFVLVVASVVLLRAPQVTQMPEAQGTAERPMAAGPTAASERPIATGEGEQKRAAEPQRPRTMDQVDKRGATQPSAPAPKVATQAKKDVERDVWLSRGSSSGQEEAARRDELGLERSQAPAAAKNAPAAAPEGRVSAGIAEAPASPADFGLADDEATTRSATTAAHEHGSDRAPAQALVMSRAKTSATRVRARLVPLAGGPVRLVEVSPALLAGAPQLVEVDAAGRLRLVVGAAKPTAPAGVSLNGRRDEARLSGGPGDERAFAKEDRSAIEALGLTPGRYRLERIDE
jgi:hypothetical protein